MSPLSPPPGPIDLTDLLASATTDAAEAETVLGLAGGNVLGQAVQFQADWARDASSAWARIVTCDSLADLIALPPAWAMARARSYADAGLRLVSAAILPTQAAAARAGAFHLPD